MLFKKVSLSFISLFALGSLFVFTPAITRAVTLPVVAVRDPGFAAKYVSQSINDPIKVEAEATVTVDFKFKNVGTATWDSNSKNFVSAFTMEPRYHISDFAGANWLDKEQTAKIAGKVKPGETGVVSVQIKAPEKTGTYTEKFWLASQNYSWIKGGYFYFILNVVPKTTVSTAPSSVTTDTNSTTTVQVSSSEYRAKQFILNTKSVTASGGEKVKVILGLQNLGTATWQKYAIVANSPVSLASEAISNLTFADTDWKNNNTILEKTQEVAQWGVTRDQFNFVTPSKAGTYTLTLKLKANDKEINGMVVDIPVTVTSNAPNYVDAPVNNPEVPRLASEPTIRVGIWQNPTDKVKFQSADDDYVVFAGGVQQGILTRNTLTTMYYQDGTYYFNSLGLDFSTSDFIRLVPQSNMHAVYSLVNYDREVGWKGPVNFNKYRGVMELRKVSNSADVYVIEEVLMEDYVAGIAETSNIGPTEYVKALLVAARTYGYYIKEYTTKHDSRNFDVVANTGDQLYLGYASELLMSNVVAAQKATKGYMITYNSDIVITPYYGNSDGRTRSWTEVWGGAAKPWLVSVPAVYDQRDNMAMYGHGVGMSARDAAYMADEGGKSWQEILHYYYTGININLIYQ